MLFSSVRFIALLSVIGVVIAFPLGIEYDKTTGLDADETANKGRLDAATTEADRQVTKMREGFDKYKAGDPKAKALYEASFGKNADADEVDKTITALQGGNIKAKLATHTFTGNKKDTIASVPWTKKNQNTPWTAGNAQFSEQFHGGGATPLDDKGRAGTIIHEATHQLRKTGDDVNLSDNIIKPTDGSSKKNGLNGYTSNANMHKTAAEVNADTGFTDVRDKANNMHHNAESYAVFASLCSQPGALRRRDIRLYNRALLDGDHEQLHSLARRNSCQLPPDYFAKKAAAKKAAAEKAASGSVKPELKSKARAKDVPHTAKGLSLKATAKGGHPRHLAKSITPKGLNALKGSKKLKGNGQAIEAAARKQASKGTARSVFKAASAVAKVAAKKH